jgi:hypothetical protein
MVKMRRRAVRGLGMAMAAAACAAPSWAAPPSGPDLIAWLSQRTDLLTSQVVITGPDNVYSLEPVGPGPATGQTAALVRTEALADDWGAAHGFQSWEANLIIDCAGGRLKVTRSASYPERNRQGPPMAGASDGDWKSPKAGEPAVKLIAAACDPAFAWPLRSTAAPPLAPTKVAEAARPPAAVLKPSAPPLAEAKPPPAPEAKAAPAAPAPAVKPPEIVQMAAAAPTPTRPVAETKPAPVAIPKSSAGQAAEAKGPSAPAMVEAKAAPAIKPPEIVQLAAAAPAPLPAAAVAKPAPAPALAEGKPTTAAPPAPPPAAVGPPAPAKPVAAGGQFAVQIGRGPSEEGAKRTLTKARRALGPVADGLSDLTETAELSRNRHRFTSLLSGFPTSAAATAACARLETAKQSCMVREMPTTAASAANPAEPGPKVAASASEPPSSHFVQVGRGPSEAGARKALEKARMTLGPLAAGLTDSTETTQLGYRRRYTARLQGFPTAAAAEAACGKLTEAGQSCFARPAAGAVVSSVAETAPKPR